MYPERLAELEPGADAELFYVRHAGHHGEPIFDAESHAVAQREPGRQCKPIAKSNKLVDSECICYDVDSLHVHAVA